MFNFRYSFALVLVLCSASLGSLAASEPATASQLPQPVAAKWLDLRDQCREERPALVITARRSEGTGFGHVYAVLGMHRDQACFVELFGLYPKHGSKEALQSAVIGPVEGEVKATAADLRRDLVEEALILELPPATAKRIRSWLEAEARKRQRYDLGSSDCVKFIERLLREVGITHRELQVPLREANELPITYLKRLVTANQDRVSATPPAEPQ